MRQESSQGRIQPARLLRTKLSTKKRFILLSITFVLYNNPSLNNYFHINKQINQLINNQMEKELFKLSSLN